MPNLNKATLIGHVGRDPDMNTTKDGREVANFSIATTERWKDKASGEKKEETTWHNIVAFGRFAEVVGQYVTKGMPLYVEGKIKHEKYTKDGVEKTSTKIIADQILMLGGKGEREPQARDDAPKQAAPVQADFDDSIPF